MSFHYGTSRADFRKGVLLIHRRGQKIAFAEQLVDESSPIDRGRKTRLECQSLVAEFGSSPADASSGRASRSADGVAGLNLGDIQQLDASGGVLLDDDLVTIQAHRIVKFPSSDLLRVFGSEAADAEFFGKRPGEPRFRGKEFNFNLATGDVELVGRHEIRIRR